MKNKLMLVLLSLMAHVACCQVNTTDQRVSLSKEDSKNNNVFINDLYLVNSSDSNIVIEDAWVEKVWFYANSDGTKLDVHDECCICFKLKQKDDLLYRTDNYKEWAIIDPSENKYIALLRGVYVLNIGKCYNREKAIELELYKRSEKDIFLKERVGKIIFKME